MSEVDSQPISDLKEIQNELNTELESTELETEQGLSDEFGLAQIIDALLTAWAERVREGLGEKIKMNEFELRALNQAINPLIRKLLARIGIEETYFLGIIGAVAILLPRIITIINEGKKEKKQIQNNVQNNNQFQFRPPNRVGVESVKG